jgi:glycosyltransferase involved in cell wall biosynthesis
VSERWPVLLMVRELGIGGCERDLTKLAKRLDRERFEPHVGCFRGEGLRTAELREAGVPIVQFPVTSFKNASFLKGVVQFRQYVRRHRIRLLHTFDTPTNIFGVAAARFSGLRPAIASQLWFLNTIDKQFWGLHRMSLKFADAAVANSNAVRRELITTEKVPEAKVFVSHNGVETNVFCPGQAATHPSLADSSIVVGAVCALRSEKRLDLLLDAFSQIRTRFPGSKLLIVGSGEMLEPLERRAEQLKIVKDCVFEPAKTSVAGWMRAIDVFVMASQSESFPNALLEAMSCGCCVVGSSVGGIPELIEDGESGLLFRSGDANDLAKQLARVIECPEMRNNLARGARRRAVDEFSMERATARMEQFYAATLERTAAGHSRATRLI